MEKSSFKPYIVTGYPRSGTAWVANLLTTDRTSCLHEGSVVPNIEAWLHTTPNAGISCPSAALFGWVGNYRVLKIERDKQESRLAFRTALRGAYPSDFVNHYDLLEVALANLTPELTIPFGEVFSRGEEIWRWAYPHLEPNPLRLTQLSDTKVEQNLATTLKRGLSAHLTIKI